MINKLSNILVKFVIFLNIFIILNLFLSINLNTFKSNNTFTQSISTGLNISKEEVNKNITNSGHSIEGYKKSVLNQESIIQNKVWLPTNYTLENIKSNIYTVQLGDTLWEISEGYYGNGFNWINILNNNPNSIGYLPDGTQALIIPGQILSL